MGVMSGLRPIGDMSISLAMYGALHAVALTVAVKSAHPIGQKCLFVAIAAALSVLSLRVGILGREISETFHVFVGGYSLLALCAATGAVTYGVLIRIFGMRGLSSRAIAAISVGCAVATLLAALTVSKFRALGVWWPAVLWWHAFSAGLWYADYRASSPNTGADR